MSILKDFYTLLHSESNSKNQHRFRIMLNKDHEIFKGHFPGNPVAPGVCMMQIVKELTEEILQSKIFLISANNVKFMAIINPEENPELTIDLDVADEDENIKVKNTTTFGETIALKMSVNYKKI